MKLKKLLSVILAMAMCLSLLPASVMAEDEGSSESTEEYTYLYAALTWAEYWENEKVYAAGSTDSSDKVDSKGESDKGAFDAVSRATTNHGLHRGSYQCSAVITDTDGKTYDLSYWSEDGSTMYFTDGTSASWSKGTMTFSDGTTATMEKYEVTGTKYVPVKVATDDLTAFEAEYSVVENGGTLQGGYSEKNLNAYTATAAVDENTNGLKTATKNDDGSFTFSAAQTGTGSGLADTDLKTASDIEFTVKEASGSYGEFLRVDLTGDGYGALGAMMQSVEWTYYGSDDTYTNKLETYGTKFAADNWMHKSMGIQLGLTDSLRCQLPEDTDGTGYWTITVRALGYADYTFGFEVTEDNIVKDLSNATVTLESTELTYTGEEQEPDVTVTLDGETVDEDNYEVEYENNTNVGTATVTVTGESGGYVNSAAANFTITQADLKNAVVSVSDAVFTGKAQEPDVTVELDDVTIDAANYDVAYTNNTNVGTATVTVTGKENCTGTATATFAILPADLTKAVVSVADATYTGKALTPAVTVKLGDVTVDAANYDVAYTNNTNAGTATVTVTGKGSYTGTAVGTFTIAKAANKVTAKNVTKTASTKAQSFSLSAKAAGGTLSYKSNSTSVTVNSKGKVTIKKNFVGKATITITAKDSNYETAKKKITVTVKPASVKITSVTNKKGKKLTVKWAKNSKVTGYQIQYSTDKNFKKNVTKKTVKSAKTTSKTYSGLKKGKKYYVRIRTYKTVSGTKYYSSWKTYGKAVKISK